MTIITRKLWLAWALVLTACASAPISYFTLSPGQQSRPPATPSPILVEVAPISVPIEVDRQELVVRQGDGKLDLLDRVRWIAPLADEIQSAFNAGLDSRLNMRNMAGLPRTPGMQVIKIKLVVRRFESAPDQYAALVADWSINWPSDAGNKQLLCNSNLRMPVTGGYAGIALGHQQLVAQLADQVAATLNAGSTASCPASPA